MAKLKHVRMHLAVRSQVAVGDLRRMRLIVFDGSGMLNVHGIQVSSVFVVTSISV